MKRLYWYKIFLLLVPFVVVSSDDSVIYHALNKDEAIPGLYLVAFQEWTSDEEVERILYDALVLDDDDDDPEVVVLQERRFRYALNAVTLQFYYNDNANIMARDLSAHRRRREADKMTKLLQSPLVRYIQEVRTHACRRRRRRRPCNTGEES